MHRGNTREAPDGNHEFASPRAVGLPLPPPRMNLPDDRLIFAVDVADEARAVDLVRRLRPWVGTYKLGLELLMRGGMDLVARIARGAPVFVDAKLHDVPATVARSVRQIVAGANPVRFITVHDAVEAAVEAADGRAGILCVTVLTSEDPAMHGGAEALREKVVARAVAAMARGAAGVVCAPTEARAVRQAIGPLGLIVTPGVRPAWAEVQGDDQRRTATAAEALAEGASMVVVGRPLRDAADPEAAARRLVAEMVQTPK